MKVLLLFILTYLLSTSSISTSPAKLMQVEEVRQLDLSSNYAQTASTHGITFRLYIHKPPCKKTQKTNSNNVAFTSFENYYGKEHQFYFQAKNYSQKFLLHVAIDVMEVDDSDVEAMSPRARPITEVRFDVPTAEELNTEDSLISVREGQHLRITLWVDRGFKPGLLCLSCCCFKSLWSWCCCSKNIESFGFLKVLRIIEDSEQAVKITYEKDNYFPLSEVTKKDPCCLGNWSLPDCWDCWSGGRCCKFGRY